MAIPVDELCSNRPVPNPLNNIYGVFGTPVPSPAVGVPDVSYTSLLPITISVRYKLLPNLNPYDAGVLDALDAHHKSGLAKFPVPTALLTVCSA